MRLILHIGTHKTGTSSLQKFLLLNRESLANRGIYYASRQNSYNSNYLAKLVAFDQKKEAQKFIHTNIQKALAISAHTMIISGESFYAMTKFFYELESREFQNYWQTESSLIQGFSDILPSNIQTKVIVNFRRQDRFLESMYGQLIKSRAVTQSIDEFSSLMKEAMDYWQHIEIWNSLFSDCSVCSYETFSKNINDYFLTNILDLEDTNDFSKLELRTNERLSRDVLEYKRLINRQNFSPVDRRMNSMACAELSKAFPETGKYTDYLTYDARLNLTKEAHKGNANLINKFGMLPFPTLSNDPQNISVQYPGLSAEKAIQIAFCHNSFIKSFRYQKERLGLIIARGIRRRFPLFAWLITIGRTIVGQGIGQRIERRSETSLKTEPINYNS